jgi:hypothetical protein
MTDKEMLQFQKEILFNRVLGFAKGSLDAIAFWHISPQEKECLDNSSDFILDLESQIDEINKKLEELDEIQKKGT